MAINFVSFQDASSSSQSVDIGTGSNRCLVFVGATAIGSDSITAVSVNGESFTKQGSRQSGGGNRYQTIWTLLNPSSTGTQTLTITGTVSVSGLLLYSGVDEVKNFNSNAAASGTSGSVSITADNGDWLVGGGISDVNTINASTNTTLRSGSSSIIQVDSNGVASPTALNFTFQSGGWCVTGVAIGPAPETNIKTWDGLSRASVKTLDSVTSSNIKSINGIE